MVVPPTLPSRIWRASSRLRLDNRVNWFTVLGAVLPGIIGRVGRCLHRRIESGAKSFAVIYNDGANSLDAHPGDEVVGALAPFSVLAIELHEPAA
jgi:hypothetical protein